MLFDHSYVARVVAKYPGRFVGCCLADPSEGGGGAEELARLLCGGEDGDAATSGGASGEGASDEGEGVYRAVRFNPGLWPEGERMTNSVGKAMFKLAGERGAPVGFMCFHGLHLHVADIRELLAEFPNTPVLMDHFGFCKGVEDPNWPALLSLAEFPQVTVKASAQFRVVPPPGYGAAADDDDVNNRWPYPTTGAQLRQLLDAFGAGRVVWGSDFPFVTEQCGYERAAEIVGACGAELSDEELAAVTGGNLSAMFPGGWY